MSDVLKRVLCLALAFVVVFSFAGCRKSPVLEQTIYTQDAETDPNNQQTDNDEEHTQEDTTLPPRTTQQTASRQSEQTKVSAKPQSNPNNNNNRTNTTQGNQAPTNGNNSNGQNNQQNPNNPNNGNNQAQGNTPGVNPNPDSGTVVIDDKAPYDPSKIPENLSKVAAYGDVGLYIEMLGGTGRLVATSDSLKNNAFANQVFSDLGPIPSVWSGYGNNEMSTEHFDALKAAKPEAVFFLPGSLNQSQLNELDALEIYALSLAPFSTTKNIITNVQLLGKVLGKPKSLPNAPDANKRAEEYVKWLEDIIGRFPHPFSGPDKINLDQDGNFLTPETDNNNADEGYYTILIDGWDENISVNNDSGGAYARTGYTSRKSPASYFLSLGGAANKAILNAQDVAGTVNYFPIVPTANEYNDSRIKGELVTTGIARSAMRTITANLGSTSFRKVIVDSEATRTAMRRSYAWEPGQQPGDGTGHAYINSIGADTQIIGSYDIIVNPHGIGSWTEGSPESPLEALWANALFNEDNDENGAFDAIRTEIQYFYSKFYGYDNLSDSDFELIKAGA